MTEPNEDHHIERMPNKDTGSGGDPVWTQNGHEHHEQGTQAVKSNEEKGEGSREGRDKEGDMRNGKGYERASSEEGMRNNGDDGDDGHEGEVISGEGGRGEETAGKKEASRGLAKVKDRKGDIRVVKDAEQKDREDDNEEESENERTSGSEVDIEDVFPQGSTLERNVHDTYTDKQLIKMMRDAWKGKKKTKLRVIAEDVWDRKGNLKKKFHYLLRLPQTKNPEDSLTAEEKQAFIEGTPKSHRNRQFETLFNAKGEIRQRKRPPFTQPCKDGTTLMESPVYKPQGVLPTSAEYAKHLVIATAPEPSARNLGVNRLSTARRQVADEKRTVIAEQDKLHKIQESIRKEYAHTARENTQMKRKIQQLETMVRKFEAKGKNQVQTMKLLRETILRVADPAKMDTVAISLVNYPRELDFTRLRQPRSRGDPDYYETSDENGDCHPSFSGDQI